MSAAAVAECVLSTFDALPAKRKPRLRDDGSREWVPLSGIVLSKGDGSLTCAALGTGMKCLPRSKLHLAKGVTLHDWHAEILAIRAFNSFLIKECADLAGAGLRSSQFLRRREEQEISEEEFQPYAINEDVQIFMYCSEAPCGDASMELVMNAQEDATPWELPDPLSTGSPDSAEASPALTGRGYFSALGIVRRKPSRPDAPPTLSKSCTDKLALKQCTSLLNSLTSLLINPGSAYLSTLILPDSQHVPEATVRAFGSSGRMSGITPSVTSQWTGGYEFHPFKVASTPHEFSFSRRCATPGQKLLPSNVSTVWTPHFQETMIGGVLQGRKQFDPRGASKTCRLSMWKAAAEVIAMLALPKLVDAVGRESYANVKADEMLRHRRRVEHDVKALGLKGWVRNAGDDHFGLKTS